MSQSLISHTPVLNRLKRIIGLRLHVHGASPEDCVATLDGLEEVWPEGKPVFVDFGDVAPTTSLLAWRMPGNAVIEIPAARLAEPAVDALVRALRKQGGTLCLQGFTPAVAQQAHGFRFMTYSVKGLPEAEIIKLTETAQYYALSIAEDIAGNDEFHAAMEGGASGGAGWFFTQAMPPVAKELNPSHAHIVRVLNLVRGNADIRDIETALKQDLAMSFKLLRYINSAGFGLSVEIQSFRHAVTILGYDKLNRWLSLLLVTANKEANAPALTLTALQRGRLMEFLGEGFFERQELDNLFITGAFSLLEALLGTETAAVLEQMNLPESITEALLFDEGVYAPFLRLTRACEGADGARLLRQLEEVPVAPALINRAQLMAASFAEAVHEI